MPYELSSEAVRRAREAFERVLASAVPAYEVGQLLLFHDDDEAFIRKEVERKLYEPALPNAGSKERKMIERFKKMARERDWNYSGVASLAARKWAEVLAENPRNPGRYYTRRPLTERTNKKEVELYRALREMATVNREWDRKWFAEQMLDGLPEGVSNFVLECLFLLRGSDGKVTRLVRLKNLLGETSQGPNPGGSEILDADAFCAPEKFRRWCLGKGNFNWAGNQKELQMLHEDVGREAAWRVVTRADSCGWLPLGRRRKTEDRSQKSEGRSQRAEVRGQRSEVRGNEEEESPILDGLWFFEECAYANAGGKTLTLWPDDDGIIWHEGEPYHLGEMGREAEFVQKKPRMRPGLKVEASKFDFATWENKVDGASPTSKSAAPEEIMRCFFRELCGQSFKTLGSYEGWLALGSMFGYAAGPEIYREYNFCGGLWVHGLMESGKSLLVSWLMRIWGFEVQAGIGLLQKTSTAVGLLQQQENYSYLPLWVDEFRAGEVSEDKLGILRNAYDRSGQAKWSPDGISRQFKTSFVVGGETTSNDAATRSRYAHVQASAAKRGDTIGWFMEHGQHLYLFGRLLMERRGEFVRRFRDVFKGWITNPALAKVNARERAVHGVAYAGWLAMASLLESHDATELSGFKAFMMEHLKGAASDVTSETNINVFWTDLITAYKEEAVPLECFRIEREQLPHPPGATNQNQHGGYIQGNWKSYRLFMDPERMLSALGIYMTKGRATVALKRKDLRDQLSKNPYWIEGKIKKRFGQGGEVTHCWGVKVDLHPLGYQGPVPDEAHEHYLLHPEEGDPRKGPLYVIVHALEAKERAAQ